MRRISAIAFALMLALILLLPTMGYSVQIGNHSYSLNSARHNYSIGVETPSHEPAVVVTKVPNSLKYGTLYQPEANEVGVTAKSNVIGKATPADMGTSAQTKTPAAPTAEQKYFLQGVVFDDQNGNGINDNGEPGLANWTVNLEQPSANMTSKSISNTSGGYIFNNLLPGNYIVTEAPITGWSITSPSNGRYDINLTNNVTALEFGNEMMPVQVQNTTATSNVTSPANVTSPENASALK